MSFGRVKSFLMWNLMVLTMKKLHSSSEGRVLNFSPVYLMLTLLGHSYARSADALKELTRLIPNFQKKIDEAEPDEAQDFYSMVREEFI